MGCANCNKLYQNALAAAKMTDQEVRIAKVEDIQKISFYGVLSVPALVVDGVVKAVGKIPRPEEILQWIE